MQAIQRGWKGVHVSRCGLYACWTTARARGRRKWLLAKEGRRFARLPPHLVAGALAEGPQLLAVLREARGVVQDAVARVVLSGGWRAVGG